MQELGASKMPRTKSSILCVSERATQEMLGDESRNQKKPQLEVDICELHKYHISANSNIIPSAHLRQQYSPQPVRGYIYQVLRLGCFSLVTGTNKILRASTQRL